MSQSTKRCEACGADVTYDGHRGFRDAHANCHLAGTSAVVAGSYEPCPVHGTLVWVVGPYSAFRACANRSCTVGRRGKPWRYAAPRGIHAADATPAPEPIPPAPTTPSPDKPATRWIAGSELRVGMLISAYRNNVLGSTHTNFPGVERITALTTNLHGKRDVVTDRNRWGWAEGFDWLVHPDDNANANSTPTPSNPEEQPVPRKAADDSKSIPSNANAVDLKALGSLGDAIQSYVDARASQLASEMITEALKSAAVGGPSRVDWTVNDKPFAAIDGAHHKALPRLLKLYAAGFRNFLIVGPAGSGKTTLAHNLATALSAIFGSVSCTGGMSESALTGRTIPNLTTGTTVFESTDFVRCYETGGVFLLDEVDAADPNVMLVINSALSNGSTPLPARVDLPTAKRHENAVIICAANTWGTGADRQYVGRNQLDAAFLDRFVGCTIEVDYDRDLEAKLVGDAHVCAKVWAIRDKVCELKLRRVVGTRFVLAVARLVKGAGETLDAALTACTTGWTSDERSKVGVRHAA